MGSYVYESERVAIDIIIDGRTHTITKLETLAMISASIAQLFGIAPRDVNCNSVQQ